MAKRFTDTTKWDKVWFFNLSNVEKSLWDFMYCRCDTGGVFEPNWIVISMYMHQEITEFPEALLKQLQPLKNNKWWLKDYLRFQGYIPLRENVPAHRAAITCLNKVGIDWKPLTLEQPLFKGSKGVKDKDTDKDKDKVKDKEKDNVVEMSEIDIPSFEKEFPEVDVPHEFEKFKLFLGANGIVYRNYVMGFRKWLMSEHAKPKIENIFERVARERAMKKEGVKE